MDVGSTKEDEEGTSGKKKTTSATATSVALVTQSSTSGALLKSLSSTASKARRTDALKRNFAVLSVPKEQRNTIPVMLHVDSRQTKYCSVVGKTLWFTKDDIMKRRSSGNGLRQFAMSVLRKVEKKGVTSYNEVADELVRDLQTAVRGDLTHKSEEKNIRRRVYDALNVLMALKIIRKDHKDILWNGMPATLAEQCKRTEREYNERQRRVDSKRQELTELTLQLIAFKNLLLRNRVQSEKSAESEHRVQLHLPFIVVNTSKETAVDCWLSSDRRAFMFNFDRRFEIHDDVEVLKRMGMTFGLERGECHKPGDLIIALTMVPDTLHHLVVSMITKSKIIEVVKSTAVDAPSETKSNAVVAAVAAVAAAAAAAAAADEEAVAAALTAARGAKDVVHAEDGDEPRPKKAVEETDGPAPMAVDDALKLGDVTSESPVAAVTVTSDSAAADDDDDDDDGDPPMSDLEESLPPSDGENADSACEMD